MIGNFSVQLYPYTKLSKLEFEKILKLLKHMNISSVELTSELLKKYEPGIFQDFFVRATHLNEIDSKYFLGKKIIPSLIKESDFIFPLSSVQYIIPRNLLNIFYHSIFGYRYRRKFLNQMKTNGYFKKEYWVELAAFLNSKKEHVLHNHSIEMEYIAEGQRPWEILHKYLVPEVKFQFDPQNLRSVNNLEDLLVKFHQRIESMHIDLNSNLFRQDQKDLIVEFIKVAPSKIDIVLEPRDSSLKNLENQLEEAKKLFELAH